MTMTPPAPAVEPAARATRDQELRLIVALVALIEGVRGLTDVPILFDDIAKIPEVLHALGMSGTSDLMVQVVSRDAHDLFRIDGEILAIDGVERTETSLSMGELIPYRITQLLRR